MAWTNILGQTRVGIRGVQSQVQTTSLLLDSYSGSAAAYSLRKLRSSYTGNAIKVRRSSDNAEINIGFNSDGDLNTFTLLTFIGVGNNGFVTTWYDQSGNSINLTQATAAYQPKIVNNGLIMTKNNKYCIDFTSGQYLRSDNRVIGLNETSVFNVFSIKSLTSRGVAWDIGKSDTSYNFYAFDINTYNTSGSKFGFYTSITAFDSNISTNLNQNLISVISNNSSGNNIISNTTYYINNTLASLTNSGGGSGAVYSSFSGANRITVGDFQNFPAPFSGTHQEIIFYQTNQSTNRLAISNNINGYYSIYPPTVSDTNAQAFLNAASITNLTQANAINTLVTELKSAGVWTKMKAIYPFVGGTAESHKWNLKDPRDLDAAYRLVFNGGWTHSSTGILPNGTNAYADTKLIPSQQYSTNSSVSFGVYSRNDKLENSTELNAYSGASQNMGMEPRWTDGKFYGYAWQDGIGTTSVTLNSGSLGLLSVTRQSSNTLKTFRNNILIGNQTSTVSGTLPTNSVRLSMGGVAGYSSREKAFAYIGDGISDNEISLLSTAIQRFQTSLSRHVGVPVGTILTKPVGSPNIVSTDLVFNIDPSNTSSYSGTGTTVYDLSGNNYTGTLQSGCYYDSESLGNFVFDGINDYINLPHSILSGTGDFTVNIWVKNINSTYGTIFANYPAGNLQIFYGSNSIGFWLNNDTAYMTSANSIKEITTIPRMLTAIRRNGSILEFYLDGVLKKTGSSTSTIGSVSNFRMGTNTIGTEVMNASIYTLQAYSRALSTGEITQNFNATKWRFGL